MVIFTSPVLIICCFLALMGSARGEGLSSVNILEMSESKRTIVLNWGKLDGLREKERGTLLRRRRKNNFSVELMADLILVKRYNTFSIWYLPKVYTFEKLEKSKSFLLGTESGQWSGHRDYNIQSKTLISPEEFNDDAVMEAHQGTSEVPVKLGASHIENSETLQEKKSHQASDYQSLEVQSWGRQSAENKVYPHTVLKGPSEELLRERLKLEFYEKMVVGYIKKAGDKNLTWESLYNEQRKEPGLGVTNEMSTTPTVFEEVLELREKEHKDQLKLVQAVEEKGLDWSKQMSDEELELFVTKNSLDYEFDRQRSVMIKRYRSEFTLFSSMNLANNRTDTGYSSAGRDYSMEYGLAWEYYLARRYQSMAHLTFELSGRRAYDVVQLDPNNNGTTIEDSFGVNLFFYPLHYPSEVGRLLWVNGLGVRYGKASIAVAGEPGNEANYSFLSFPVLSTGLKYHFKNSIGIRTLFSYETYNLTRTEKSETISVLGNEVTKQEWKLGFGVSYFF